MKKRQKDFFLRIFLFVFVISITIIIFLYRDQIRHLEKYGYAGIFFLSVLANATIILPIPGVVITALMGAVFSPVIVALVAGAGATLGEFSGYLAGYSGKAVVENQKWYLRSKNWMREYGSLALFLLAFLPNPLFDLAGIAAGMMKMKIGKFLFWVLLGKVLKMLVFAYGGNLLSIFLAAIER